MWREIGSRSDFCLVLNSSFSYYVYYVFFHIVCPQYKKLYHTSIGGESVWDCLHLLWYPDVTAEIS